MRRIRMRAWAALAALFLAPASASSAVRGTLRFGAGLVEPTGSLTGRGQTVFSIGVFEIFDVDNRYEVEPQAGIAPFASFELRVGGRVGLELAVSRVASDLEVDVVRDIVVSDNDTGQVLSTFVETEAFTGDLDATFVTVGVNVHLLPRRSFDLYAGPLAGYALYDDVTFSPSAGPTTVGVDDDFALGAQVGLDVPLGSGGWLLATSARLLSTGTRPGRVPGVLRSKFFDVDDFAPADLALDPLEVRLGVARRFGR